jgi:hypothetical protein
VSLGRTSVSRGRRASVLVAASVALAFVVAGCSGGGPSQPPPTPAPTPTPTPNPHLLAPASVDTVFTWLTKHGISIVPNNADTGPSGEPVKRINATYAGWPLILSQYSTEAAAREASGVTRKTSRPHAEDAPFTFLGLNVVVDFGPRLRRDDDPLPDARFVAAATALGLALEPILGPLGVRTAVQLALPTASQAPASASPVGSGTPKATKKPTKKPKPKPKASPKPSG